MSCNRREIALLGAVAAAGLASGPAQAAAGGGYGLVSQILAVPGKRQELVSILLEGAADMPGCRAYLVAADLARDDAIWVTEIWDSRESHARAVDSQKVRAAIARGGPLIAGFASHAETTPLGGVGLAKR